MVDGGAGMFFVVIVIALVTLGIRLAAGGMDHGRVREEIGRRGGSVEAIQWRPFGHGWFGGKGDSIYNVTYRNEEGRRVMASFKTRAFSGVYQTQEHALEAGPVPEWPQDPTRAGPQVTELEALRRENERLSVSSSVNGAAEPEGRSCASPTPHRRPRQGLRERQARTR